MKMYKYIVVLLGLFTVSTVITQGQKRETAHFKARYPVEAADYAIASLEILEAAWTVATNSGFSLPEKIRFSMKKSDRNALYFDRKNLKELTWEYENLSEMLPPEQSRKNNIYGLCHEIGHLCMHNTNHNRNNWMTYEYREAWADYFGNVIIDSLYEDLGTDIWPEPHDYRKYAGMTYFLERIERNDPEVQSFNNAGLFWFELGSEIGFNHIQEFFTSLDEMKVNNPGAKEKFTRVLEDYINRPDLPGWFAEYADDLIINEE